MKRTFLTMFVLCTLFNNGSFAQVINGDLNHNDNLDVEDVTLLIDGYLTGESETISVATDPYDVDNSRVVGTWRKPTGESITFNADGTTSYLSGCTYKFIPSQGCILFFDATGTPVDYLKVMYFGNNRLGDYMAVKVPEEKGVQVYYTVPDATVTYTVNGVSFKMILVEGGTFQMGSTDGDYDEEPVHEVTLSDYRIGETEVTQALWTAVMGENPSRWQGDNLPVHSVSWNFDVQEFLKKLNQLTGKTFRLPTEAEWEYAARGGNKSQGYKYSGSNDVDEVAWYYYNNNEKPYAVGTKKANELGLYDMNGNVYEWCQDWWNGSYYSVSPQFNPTGPEEGDEKVSRGGCFDSLARTCTTTYRRRSSATGRSEYTGFRLAQ